MPLPQAEGDAAKIKAMRTCVGWFSSPACALIYQVAKYVELCSSKGYAIGQKFLEWIEARLADTEDLEGELLGHSEDILAICGGRMYVFFLDAAPTERLITQQGSLLTFLEEEAEMGAEGGGKLRASILTGANSEPMLATLRAMAIICDSVLWPLLRAVKPDADKHVLDVLPQVWPKALEFFCDAAERPAGVIDGTLRLDVREAPLAASASQAKRSERARIDMQRIRGKATGDPVVEQLLKRKGRFRCDGEGHREPRRGVAARWEVMHFEHHTGTTRQVRCSSLDEHRSRAHPCSWPLQ